MKKEKIFKILIVIFILLGITSICFYIFSFQGGLADNHSRWAEFGSFIGGILSPIVGILAFIGLFYNLELTKKQFSKDNSDNTFFKMVDLHIKKVDSITYTKSPNIDISSFEAFKHYTQEYNKLFDLQLSRIARGTIASNCEKLNCNGLTFLWGKFYQYFDGEKHYTQDYSKLFNFFSNRSISDNLENIKATIGTEENIKNDDYKNMVSIGFGEIYDGTSKERIQTVQTVHSYFYQEFGHMLGHYFRNIHYMLEFIDNSNESKKYSKIFRAQLSRYELALIYYNALSSMSSVRTVKLLIKYNILNELYSSDISYEPNDDMVREDLKERINTK